MSESAHRVEIQTCSDWRGDGLALHEIEGGTRHRWHCLDCDEKGPAEVDGAVCKWQLTQHYAEKHRPAENRDEDGMPK